MKEYIYTIEDIDPVILTGVSEKHLHLMEKNLDGIELSVRGNRLLIKGEDKNVDKTVLLLDQVSHLIQRKGCVNEYDLDTLINLANSDIEISTSTYLAGDAILIATTGEKITARTPGQKTMVKTHLANDIMFAIGPAGTGKTYTAVALAVKALKDKRIRKIVLCRPAVEAGENLGFLPGDLKEKIDPYLRPLYDALEEMIDSDKLAYYLQKNIIEIVPLAYMRGRTLNNSFVILDEAQNTTHLQMKMFLTRLGINSTAIVTGDITQTDLPTKQQSGLISIQRILDDIKGIGFVYLDEKDVVRHKLIRDIINAYELHEKK